MSIDAQDRGWGPGWPDCQSHKIKTLVRKDGLRLPVRAEILPLVAWLMDETERRGYNIVPGWTWGYACRPIRGSQRASNHSWGLAVDVNAPKNPMGSRLITDMPGWMPDLWEAHMFRWGGTYRSRPDAMHYEFMGSPSDAARIIADINRGNAPLNLGNKLPIRLNRDKPVGPSELIKDIQRDLNIWITKHHPVQKPNLIKVDGIYGNATAFWVAAFTNWVLDLQIGLGLKRWSPKERNNTTMGPIKYGALQYWSTH